MSLSSIGCQTKRVESHRKQVTICSENNAFSGALRVLLDHYIVDLITHPDDTARDSDVLVWQVNGVLPVDKLREVALSVPTLVLADQDQLVEAVDAGCRGFLPRTASLDEIAQAVTTVEQGGAIVPPDLLGALLRHLVERRRKDEDRSAALAELTDREREVFHLAANGARKEEIGEQLYISPATARTHLQRVYRKLGVHSQSELMALAMRIGEFEIERNK